MNESIQMEMLEKLISEAALNFSRVRRSKKISVWDLIEAIPSKMDEIENDWYQASFFYTHSILKGDICFSDLAANCYPLLENIWLKDVKLMVAYYNHLKDKFATQEQNYYDACETIRHYLYHNPPSPLDSFDTARQYLNTNYLKNDKLYFQNNKTDGLITRKAARIFNVTGDKTENWNKAKFYVELYYNNIVPAVFDKDKPSIINVLKAFEFSKSPKNRFLIINAFELAIAITFLDKEILEEILQDPSINFNIVTCTYDKAKKLMKYIKNLKFLKEYNMLVLQGTISEAERKMLIADLDQESNDIIEEITYQSQLPLEKMII